MIIGPDFVWLHFPKCAGSFTENLIRTLDANSGEVAFDVIDPSKIIWHQGVTERVNITGENLHDKKIISNFRRLPTWIISRIQFETNRSGNCATRELYRQGCFYEQNGNINFADRYLRMYSIPYVNHWLRVEYLKEDFKRVFSNHFDCRNSVFQSLFSDKVNASGWKGDVGDWLRYEDLVELYSSNPNWARLEYWLYGNLMINIRDLKPWKELSFSEFCSSEGDCLLRFGDLPGRRPSLFNYYTLHLTHPRLGGLLFGNRKALYFFRSTLVHLPNNTNDSQEGESLANITVRPVITNPQIKGVQRVKNQRSHAKARERINTISGSKADGIIFADFCANCFEINMKSVVGYIQETQQIIDLKRNALGLTFTVTGNKPSIVFKEMKEKIPWVALHLDLTLPSETRVKLYYRSNLEAEFSEDNAHQVIAGPGRQICRMELPSRKGIEVIRIQPGDIPGNYILHRVIAEI